MIVKVQASLATNADRQQVLIYNEKRDIQWQGDMDDRLKELMKGRTKVFFHARMHESAIMISREAKWKTW